MVTDLLDGDGGIEGPEALVQEGSPQKSSSQVLSNEEGVSEQEEEPQPAQKGGDSKINIISCCMLLLICEYLMLELHEDLRCV